MEHKPHICFRCSTTYKISLIPNPPTLFNGTDYDAERAGWKRFVWKHAPRDSYPFFWLCPDHAKDPYEDSEAR